MSTKELDSKVKALRELRRMADELQGEIDSLQDEIKAELIARETDTLAGTDWQITWKTVTSERLDSAALKKELPEIAARFVKQTTTRRFIVA